jgi:hypothetical protein
MPHKLIPPQTDTVTRVGATPLQGELFYDTDEDQLYYGDGTTTGGKALQTVISDDQQYTDAEKTKLASIEDGAEVNVNADWDAVGGDAEILNKPTLGSAAALNVGTSANNVVQLDGTGKLPAVDGSALINLPGGDNAAAITVDTTTFNNNLSGTDTTVQAALETLDDLVIGAGSGGHTIQDEGTSLSQRTNLDFVGAAVTVTDDAGNDKTIITITSPTLGTAAALDVGTGADNIVQLDGTGKLPAVDGSQLTNLPAGDTAVNITVDTTNFNSNLSGTDTTVQAALETLDDLVAGGGGHTIQDEGTPLTQRTNLNFVGSAVTVTDDSGNDASVVTINTSTINWLGAWSNLTTYVQDDVVEYNGSSYIANTGSINKIPGVDIEWDLMVEKGDTGATGSVSSAISLTLTEIAEPTTPSANNLVLYVDSADGALKQKNDAGTVTVVGSGGSGGGTVSTIDIYRYSGGV